MNDMALFDYAATARAESLEAFKPKIGPRQQEVLDAVYESTHITAWEIAERTGRMIHTVRPRITELAKMGLIEQVGLKFWEPTQRNEVQWRVK